MMTLQSQQIVALGKDIISNLLSLIHVDLSISCSILDANSGSFSIGLQLVCTHGCLVLGEWDERRRIFLAVTVVSAKKLCYTRKQDLCF